MQNQKKVDTTSNLNVDCNMRVENIEETVGKLSLLFHVKVVQGVGDIYQDDQHNDNAQDNYSLCGV